MRTGFPGAECDEQEREYELLLLLGRQGKTPSTRRATSRLDGEGASREGLCVSKTHINHYICWR